jgi:hypothetical protein
MTSRTVALDDRSLMIVRDGDELPQHRNNENAADDGGG